MSSHRFYLPPARWGEETSELDPADSHHCADVLRLEAGDMVVVFDGLGRVAEAELLAVHRKHCLLRIGQSHSSPPLRCSITLVQAIPKGKNMDLVIQKAVELGAANVIPLLSERTVVRLEDAADAARKQERWQSIAIEACKQCGQNWMPQIGLPVTTKEFFAALPPADLLLIASLEPDARPVKEVIAAYSAAMKSFPSSVLVMVGPEGDFTPGEALLAKAAGVAPITLGPIILRTETAALYCLSVLGHELF